MPKTAGAVSSRRVLIVSPHFPPMNAPDMQRVRISLPFFSEFGWDLYVLAVQPADGDVLEPLLSDTIPADVPIERVRSVPRSVTRFAGVGNVAVRAIPFLYAAGCRLIAAHQIDLVYSLDHDVHGDAAGPAVEKKM